MLASLHFSCCSKGFYVAALSDLNDSSFLKGLPIVIVPYNHPKGVPSSSGWAGPHPSCACIRPTTEACTALIYRFSQTYLSNKICMHTFPTLSQNPCTYICTTHTRTFGHSHQLRSHNAPPESFTHIGSHICMHMCTNVSSTSTHIYTSTLIHTPHTPRNTCIHTALMSLTYLTQRAIPAVPAQQHPSSKEFTTGVHLELPSLLIAGCLWSHLCLSLVSGLC